ncbi:MAG TPA: hypothetical protein VK021_01340 [Flavobacteriaceae bacterium]|nr:hypothetical protein [Flavobacteriaceae bacterium]
MKTIIDTVQLEYDETDILIDLVQQNNGFFYIEIVQTSTTLNDATTQRIKLSSLILTDLLKTLQNFHAKLPKTADSNNKHLTDIDQQKIQEIYLKGVPIKDIALQLGQTTELIEMVLRNKGLEIISNEPPKSWKRKYYRKKR